MKKLYYALVLVLCGSMNLFAQNLDDEPVKVKYMRHPLNPLPADVKTYNKDIYIASLPPEDDRGSITSQIDKAMNLPGYELVNENGDLTIKVSLHNMTVIDRAEKSETKESKDKDGKVTKTTSYYYVFKYKYPIQLKITNNKTGEVLFDDYIGSSQDYENGQTSLVSNRSNLGARYADDIQNLKATLRKNRTNGILNYIQVNYGYTPTVDEVVFKSVKKYKSYEYPLIDEGIAKAQAALLKLEPVEDYITPEFRAEIEGTIELFNKDLQEADFNDKKARVNEKVAAALYNNIALCYFWINEFDKCEETIASADNLKGDSWTTGLKTELAAKKKRYQANGLL